MAASGVSEGDVIASYANSWSQTIPQPPHPTKPAAFDAWEPLSLADKIKKIANFLKRNGADSKQKSTDTIVERCWKAVWELSNGWDLLEAYKQALFLPKTAATPKPYEAISLVLSDNEIPISVDTYENLIQDSPHFLELFRKNKGQSTLFIDDIKEKDFKRLIELQYGNGSVNNLDETIRLIRIGRKISVCPEPCIKFFIQQYRSDQPIKATAYHLLKDVCEAVIATDHVSQESRDTLGNLLIDYLFNLCEIYKNVTVCENDSLISYHECHKAILGLIRQLDLSCVRFIQRGSDITIEQILLNCPNLSTLVVYHPTVSDRAFKSLTKLDQLKDVRFLHCMKLTKTTFNLLAHLPLLSRLKIHECINFSDKSLECLCNSQATQLIEFEMIKCAAVTETGLCELKKLPLKQLHLKNCQVVTEKVVKELANIEGLEKVDLSECNHITDAIVAPLGAHKGISALVFDNCYQITDQAVLALKDKTSDMKVLSLNGCSQLTSQAFQVIGQMDNLRTLSLSGCVNLSHEDVIFFASNLNGLETLVISLCKRVTDEAISSLSQLEELRCLDLSETSVKDESILSLLETLELEQLMLAGCLNISQTVKKELLERNLLLTI